MNILLDFDGIVIRNQTIGKIIEQKSIDFVQSKLNISHRNSKYINRFLYKTYGHTANGIAKYTSERLDDVVYDYNDYVFNNINYKDLSSYLIKNDKDRIDTLMQTIAKTYDNKYGLFTNAPISWCENLLSCLQMDIYDIIDYDKVYTSDEGDLKPNLTMYNYIESELNDTIYFIDDSYVNLSPVLNNDRWKTYLVDSDSTFDLIDTFDKIHYSGISRIGSERS